MSDPLPVSEPIADAIAALDVLNRRLAELSLAEAEATLARAERAAELVTIRAEVATVRGRIAAAIATPPQRTG